MTSFERFGVYFTPAEGPLAAFGAQWLGWDLAQGRATAHPALEGLPAEPATLTDTPRRYGFHATIKPPFHLAEGMTPDALDAAVSGLCAELAPVSLDRLRVAALSGFIALVPDGDVTALNALAAETVRRLDEFRAPPDADELARRRARPLTARQEATLAAWGYPYVMDEFRFHMTLTGRVPAGQQAAVTSVLREAMAPILPEPFLIDALSLVGQDAQGMFHLIHRYTLSA